MTKTHNMMLNDFSPCYVVEVDATTGQFLRLVDVLEHDQPGAKSVMADHPERFEKYARETWPTWWLARSLYPQLAASTENPNG